LQAALKDLGTDMGASVLPQIEKIIHFSRDALMKFKDFVHGTKILQAAMAVLAGTAAALALSLAAPFILPALMLVALIAIIDDVSTALSGGRSLIGEWLDEWKGLGTTDSLVRELQEDLDDMHAFLPDFIGSWEIATGVIEDFGEALLYVLTLPLRGLYKLGDFLDKWVMFGWAEGKNYKSTGDQTSDWSSDSYENEQTYKHGLDSKATSGISDRQGLRRERRYAQIRADSDARPRNRAERRAKREQQRIDALQSRDPTENEALGMSVAIDPNALVAGVARIRKPTAALRSDIAPPAGRSVVNNVTIAPTSVAIQSEDPDKIAKVVGKVIDDRNDALMSVIANPIHGG
jgi:hypothetical protein